MIFEEKRTDYDPALLLTRAALSFVGTMIVFVCIIISVQIAKTGEANTESWAALTGLIGWVTGIASVIFNARFGTSQQSAAKDKIIAKQVETAAVAQAALAPLIPVPQATDLKTDVVNVSSENTVVTTEGEKKP